MTKIGKTHWIPISRCSRCRATLSACEMFDGDDKPKAGSITICLDCGHTMIFDSDLSLRELNDQELYELAGDPVFVKAQNMVGEFRANRSNERRQPKKKR
jgi:hypothetical protein